MTTKNIHDGQERFDGFAVTVYDGKFSGGFDLDEDMAKDIGFDDVVTFVVTGRVSGVNFGETKLGDVKRTNVFQVTSAAALDSKVASQLASTLASQPSPQIPGQRSIYDSLPAASAPAPPAPAEDHSMVVADDGDPVLSRFLQESTP